MSEPILEINNIRMAFGGLLALSNLSFTVPREIIKAVIGPNGAGKTTLFNIITGIYTPSAGQIHFKGKAITKLRPHQISGLGISRTFQTVELFKDMSVLENVMVGRHARYSGSILTCGLKLPWVVKQEKKAVREVLDILEFVGLADRALEQAGSLPLGDQKILEIARALATRPEVVCLDEPAAGLNEEETIKLSGLMNRILERGITVLLVEHDMSLVMRISHEIVVLNYGEKIAEGPPQKIQCDATVLKAYLGEDYSSA